MKNILAREISSKKTIKAVLIAIGMGIGFIAFGGVMLLSLYLGDKYIYDIFYTKIFSKPVWYLFLSLTFIITSLLGIWIVFRIKKIKTNSKSFTLIELLVVITIIGVLSAIVITTMSSAVTKSRIVRLQVFSDTIRAQLSDSLVSWWSFNEGTGTDAKDMWEGNDGTLTNFDVGSAWKSGGECISGSCLEFDGTNDYVIVVSDSSFSTLEQGIIEMWIHPNIISDQIFFMYGWGYSDYARLLLNTSSGTITFRQEVENVAVISINSDDSLTADTWYHLVITQDRTASQMYINGVAQNHSAETNSANWFADSGTNENIYFSKDPWSIPFNGLIDEVRIYNSTATITQIQSQYLAGLDKLLFNGAISKQEYNQRIKEISKEIVIE